MECSQPVIQCPKGFGTFASGEHIVITACSDGVTKQCEHGNKFCGCLDIEIVHAHRGNDSLRIVTDGFAQFT